MRGLDLDLVGLAVGLRLALPARDLFDAALGIFIERNAEFFDQVRRGLP